MQWAWLNPFFHLGSRDREKKAFLIFFLSVCQGATLSSVVTFCHSWCPFTLLITTHSKPIRQINGIKSHQGYQRQSALYQEIVRLQLQEPVGCPGDALRGSTVLPCCPCLETCADGQPPRVEPLLLRVVGERCGWKWMRNAVWANTLAFCSPLKRGWTTRATPWSEE